MAYILVRKIFSDALIPVTWMGEPLHLPIQQLQYIARILRENFPDNEYVVKQEGEK